MMSSASHLALHEDIDIVELADLLFAVVNDPDPRRQAGQCGFSSDAASQCPGGLRQAYCISAMTKGASRFQAGRSGIND